MPPPPPSFLESVRYGPFPSWIIPVAAGVIMFGSLAGIVWLMMDGQPGSTPPPHIVHSHIQPLYPNQPFATRPPERRVVFSDDKSLGVVFKGIEDNDIAAATAKPDSRALTEQDIRDNLTKQGYPWSSEGFINAARKGDIKALVDYIKLGMDINSTNAFGSTAVYAATEANQIEVLKLLTAARADINKPNTQLVTPLHRATELNLAGVTNLLLHLGANPNAKDTDGQTPLFNAVGANNQDMAIQLIKAGVNPNEPNRIGTTPMMIAVRKGYMDMVKTLTKQGAHIDAEDISGLTALHIAVKEGNYQLAKLLLENGAKPDKPTRNGLLPMDMALEQHDMAMANLLLAHGAKRPLLMGN